MTAITASEPDVFKNFRALGKEFVKIDLKSRTQEIHIWPLRLSNKVNSKLKNFDHEKLFSYL